MNSFVRLRKLLNEGRMVLEIDELGDAESVLHDKLHLRETAQRSIQRGTIPKDGGWSGWLGRYQTAHAETLSR